ncbi:hypothetical protein RclHR1_01490029 [Rhizophagus clarus]|uniref:Uncharacterized protein n=1 Tax=Rhizophagus clarus TaxID=94130 RepID=A0A2Z6R6L5_9GLOM|nr:hypothetical protein RclHR1_01490029 [Rhizophagus clarus]GES73367.1 hypothetical protein RCL_jg3877.t1 [Rhizophagus clarus]
MTSITVIPKQEAENKNEETKSNDTDKNVYLKNLDFTRKMLKIIELNNEAKLNIDLTRQVAGDLKTFASISILVILVGIILLVLKLTNVDPSSLKIIYTTITGSIGSLGILKTAYDWFKGQGKSTTVDNNILTISDDNLKKYSNSIERSKLSFPNHESEYIYHLDLATNVIKERNYFLKSSYTRRYISFAIIAFILTALTLVSIFFGFFTSAEEISHHKRISFIADDCLLVGGVLGLLDCLCIYIIIYKPEYFKKTHHIIIFILGLSINGFIRVGYIKQMKTLVKKYRGRESGDIAREIVLTIKKYITESKGGVTIEPKVVNSIHDLLRNFGLHKIPEWFKSNRFFKIMKKQNDPSDTEKDKIENDKVRIRKAIREYFVGVDEDLRKRFEKAVNDREILKKKITEELEDDVRHIYEESLKTIETIEINVKKTEDVVEKIGDDVNETENERETVDVGLKKSLVDLKNNLDGLEKNLKDVLNELKNHSAKIKNTLIKKRFMGRLEDLNKRLKDLKNSEKDLNRRLDNLRKYKKNLEQYLNDIARSERDLKTYLKDLKNRLGVLENSEGDPKKHSDEVEYQSEKTLEKEISKKIIPFLRSKCIFEEDIEIRKIPFIKGRYHIPLVSLKDSEKANVEQLLHGFHYDSTDVVINVTGMLK